MPPSLATSMWAPATSNKLVTQGKDDVVMELPSGVSLEVEGAIFSKYLSHTLCGTTVLDLQCKVSTLFHDGSTYLFNQASVLIPRQWDMIAKEKYDKATGLPFIDMKVKIQAGTKKTSPPTTPILVAL